MSAVSPSLGSEGDSSDLQIHSPSEPLVRLEADFAGDVRFGKRVLELYADQIRILENDAVALSIPISDVRTARNEPVVGGGRLEILTKAGEILPVVTYSMTMSAKFSEVARGIEQLAKGEPLLISLKTERIRCAKCNRLLPERDGVCPACINRGKTMMRIARYLKPYRKQAILMASFSIITTVLSLVPPRLQGMLLDNVLLAQKDLGMLWRLMAVWAVVLLLAAVVQVVNGRLIAFLAGSLAADLRSSVYRAIEFLQLGFFDKKQVGAIASRVTQDTDRIWGFLVEGVPFLLINSLCVVGVTVYMFMINPVLAASVLAPLPIVGLISMIFWQPVSNMFHRVGQKWARFHMHLNESLTGIRVVKAFANEDHEFAKFNVRNQELKRAGMEADGFWYTIFGAMTFFTSLGVLICWTVGGWMVFNHRLTVGHFWMANMYLMLLYGPLQWFAQVNSWFSRAMAGAERIFEVIDTEAEKYGDAGVHVNIGGEVSFDNVRFGYDKSNPVIKGLTFTAKKGEMIGLVGKSGAGKSTTINLLCRFYEPDAGSIKIDGVDYRDIALQDLRHQIGVVLQEPFLFNGTVGENIAYGAPGASLDQIMDAAKAANAHNFILAKPDGYDTMVGEKGAKLSGGEKQRISIARAILHDPKILILDEATSSVDVETERQIQDALQHLISGRTTFAIAHRLSTLRNADRLVVLEKGQLVEIGSHAELMEQKGVFHNLVHAQSALNEIVGEFAAVGA